MGKGKKAPNRKPKSRPRKVERKDLDALTEQVNAALQALNQHVGVVFRNEKAIADMIVTNSYRIAVMRRIIREKLKIDDVAFEALVEQEIAKRKVEEAEARKAAEEAAKTRTATEKAKELGKKVSKDYVATVDDLEFGGDFGEEEEEKPDGGEEVDPEAGDQPPPGEEAGEPEGAVGDTGQDPDGVRHVAGDGEEGQAADPVREGSL